MLLSPFQSRERRKLWHWVKTAERDRSREKKKKRLDAWAGLIKMFSCLTDLISDQCCFICCLHAVHLLFCFSVMSFPDWHCTVSDLSACMSSVISLWFSYSSCMIHMLTASLSSWLVNELRCLLLIHSFIILNWGRRFLLMNHHVTILAKCACCSSAL